MNFTDAQKHLSDRVTFSNMCLKGGELILKEDPKFASRFQLPFLRAVNPLTAQLSMEKTLKKRSTASFFVRKKSQRIGRNPKTGEEVPILPRSVLIFRPSHVLKNKINIGQAGKLSSVDN